MYVATWVPTGTPGSSDATTIPTLLAGTGSPITAGVTSAEPRSIRNWYGSTLVTMLRTTTSPGPGGRSGRRAGTRSPGLSDGPGRCLRMMTSAWLGTGMSKAFASGPGAPGGLRTVSIILPHLSSDFFRAW